MAASDPRPYLPGTTGWTVDDLRHPDARHGWDLRSTDVMDGTVVLREDAHFRAGVIIADLMAIVQAHLTKAGLADGAWATEPGVATADGWVLRADAAYLTAADLKRQAEAAAERGYPDAGRAPALFVPPTLVLDAHRPDPPGFGARPRAWRYAAMGVRHYWVIDADPRTLACLALHGRTYRPAGGGRDTDQVRPEWPPGLEIRLREVWQDLYSGRQ